MSIVSIRHVSKSFGSLLALDDISIEIQAGEIFALLGPSGCGKSTLLRIISGFESPSEGELLLDGSDMTHLAPNKRPINMVFQSYAVFPHMNVWDNVAYGLKMDKVAATELSERVETSLQQVQLSEYAKRRPDQLSGGQRQRVALARALVKRPRVLLLDEPLSALDAKLRDAMRLELVKLQETVGITFIIVTHDQAEAMAMADRIAVLESGRLRQIDSPAQLYANPVDAFVADFIGNINAFEVNAIEPDDNRLRVGTELLGELTLDSTGDTKADVSTSMVVTVRPEHVSLSLSPVDTSAISIQGSLGDIAFQGQHSIAEVLLKDNPSMTAIIDNQTADRLNAAGSGTAVTAYWKIENMLLLPGQDTSRARQNSGSKPVRAT